MAISWYHSTDSYSFVSSSISSINQEILRPLQRSRNMCNDSKGLMKDGVLPMLYSEARTRKFASSGP